MIDTDPPHGSELICSFDACRSAGVKFLYCEHCDLPAGRKHFTERHLHGQCVGKTTSATTETVASVSGSSQPQQQQHEFSNERVVKQETGDSAASKESQPLNRERGATVVAVPQIHPSCPDDDMDPVVAGAPEAAAGAPSLRGEDGTASSYENVNQPASELTSQIGRAELMNQWDALLLERPARGDEQAMAEWLIRILRVSNRYTFGIDSNDRNPLGNTNGGGLPFEQAISQGEGTKHAD